LRNYIYSKVSGCHFYKLHVTADKGYTLLLELANMKYTDDLHHKVEEDKIGMWKQKEHLYQNRLDKIMS